MPNVTRQTVTPNKYHAAYAVVNKPPIHPYGMWILRVKLFIIANKITIL